VKPNRYYIFFIILYLTVNFNEFVIAYLIQSIFVIHMIKNENKKKAELFKINLINLIKISSFLGFFITLIIYS
jgi:hypothetical protein